MRFNKSQGYLAVSGNSWGGAIKGELKAHIHISLYESSTLPE